MIAPLALMALVAAIVVYRGMRREPDGSGNQESANIGPGGPD